MVETLNGKPTISPFCLSKLSIPAEKTLPIHFFLSRWYYLGRNKFSILDFRIFYDYSYILTGLSFEKKIRLWPGAVG